MYSLTFNTKTENLTKVFSICFLKSDVRTLSEDTVQIEINSFKEYDDEAKEEVLNTLLQVCDAIGSNNIKLVQL